MSEITILNPRAENAVPVTAYALSANIGVPGLRLALVSNSFFDASKLLGFVGEALSGRMQRLQIRLYEIPNASVMAGPACPRRLICVPRCCAAAARMNCRRCCMAYAQLTGCR